MVSQSSRRPLPSPPLFADPAAAAPSSAAAIATAASEDSPLPPSPSASSASSPGAALRPPAPSASPPSGSPSAWRCPFDCGQQYQRSSGRSIRRHVGVCFRASNPAAAALSDAQLQAVISQQQDSGQLSTGLKRWKMRRPRRMAEQLRDEDRWDCLWGCGKSYRATSSRSIQRHANTCRLRSDGRAGDVDAKGLREQSRRQRKKRRKYELFDRARRHGGDTRDGDVNGDGDGDSRGSSASNTPSAFGQPHPALLSSAFTTQLMHEETDIHSAADDRLAWDTSCMDGPLDYALLQEQLHPHHQHGQQAVVRPSSQLGSEHGASRTLSLSSSTWPSLPSTASSPITIAAASASSRSLLSSPPQLSWLSSASSASTSVDLKAAVRSQYEQLHGWLPESNQASGDASPPASPVHSSAARRAGASGFRAAHMAAAAAHAGDGSITQTLFSSTPASSQPVPLYPASSSSYSSSVSSELSAFPSQPDIVPHPGLYEREQQVSEELCALILSLYARYGLQHPVFQKRIVSPRVLERAIAFNNNAHPATPASAASPTSCAMSGTAHTFASPASALTYSPTAAATPRPPTDWQDSLGGLQSTYQRSPPCAVNTAPSTSFSAW